MEVGYLSSISHLFRIEYNYFYSRRRYMHMFSCNVKTSELQGKTPNKWYSSYSIGNCMDGSNMNWIAVPTIFFYSILFVKISASCISYKHGTFIIFWNFTKSDQFYFQNLITCFLIGRAKITWMSLCNSVR